MRAHLLRRRKSICGYIERRTGCQPVWQRGAQQARGNSLYQANVNILPRASLWDFEIFAALLCCVYIYIATPITVFCSRRAMLFLLLREIFFFFGWTRSMVLFSVEIVSIGVSGRWVSGGRRMEVSRFSDFPTL